MSIKQDIHTPETEPALAPTRARYKTNHCVKNVKWTKSEDELLMKMMALSERPNYSKMAASFPGKTGQQVAERWDKVLNPRLVKGSWTRHEDEIIVQYVKENGTKNWRSLCNLLPGRIGKQCRERWRNHLDPNINHDPWTPEEDALLISLHRKYGNHWVQISSMMPNRSDNAIKNRWNSTLKKMDLQNFQDFVKPDIQEDPLILDQSPISTPQIVTVLASPFGPRIDRTGYLSPVLTKHAGNPTDANLRPLSLEENRSVLNDLIVVSNS